MEVLLELVFEILLQIFGEVLLELGWAGLKQALSRENHHPAVAAVGYLILGAIFGLGGLWMLPKPIFNGTPIPGISLVLAPLAGGGAMYAWGEFRHGRGRGTTNLRPPDLV